MKKLLLFALVAMWGGFNSVSAADVTRHIMVDNQVTNWTGWGNEIYIHIYYTDENNAIVTKTNWETPMNYEYTYGSRKMFSYDVTISETYLSNVDVIIYDANKKDETYHSIHHNLDLSSDKIVYVYSDNGNLAASDNDICKHDVTFQKPSDWNDAVYVYSYKDGQDNKWTPDWAGKLMTTGTTYSATIWGVEGSTVMFNDNGSHQVGGFPLVDKGNYAGSGLTSINVTIGGLRFATLSSAAALTFEGNQDVTAYYASGVNGGKVVLSKTQSAQANQGLIITGNAGTYSIDVTDTPTTITGNLLHATTKNCLIPASTNVSFHYFLAGTTDETLGFYNLDSDAASGAGKAYLETTTALSSDPATSRVAWIFADDNTTGINAIQNSQNDDVLYDLQGRVAKTAKAGMYIKNGKKFMVK